MQIEGWVEYKGSEITTKITKGSSPKWQGFDYQNDGTLFVTSENVREGFLDISNPKYLSLEFNKKLKNSQLEVGDILINIVGASIGRSCQFNIDNQLANINQAVCLFRTNELVDKNYIQQYLQLPSTINRLLGTQTESARPNLSLGDLRDFTFILPPKSEQKKIAEILSTWDKAIETVEKLVANSQQQEKALMQQLLTGQKRLLDDNGVKFGGEWEEYSLGEWLKEYNQKSSTNNEYEVLTSSRNGLVKQSDYFGENRLVQRDNTGFNVIPPNYLTYRSRSDDGSFYFNRNNFEFNGLISTYYPVFEFPNGDTNFFLNLLNQNSTLFSAYSVGTSQKVLSLNALKQVKFRLPLKKEQEKIAQVLTLADREIDLYQQQLDKLKLEKKSLMQQLLTGQKRVKLGGEY